MEKKGIEKPYNIQDRAFEFSREIIRLYQSLYKSFSAGGSLSKQLLRSGTSIGANLEEANDGQSKPDFISKCSIALKEAKETHYWLRLFDAESLAPKEKLQPLIIECNEIISILITIIKKAKQNPDR